jgi:hypothetical protein
VTVWVKRMDVVGARYVDVESVDLEQTVSKFIARWVAQAKLDVDPSLVTLRLVKCGARKPSAEEEKQAVELDDPSLHLADTDITGTAWLLAFVASSALRSPCTVSNYISDSGTPRSGPPLPEDLVAARTKALSDLDVGVRRMQHYFSMLVQAFDMELPVPHYVTVPPHPSLQHSSRRRFTFDDGSFTFMCRELSRRLAQWLLQLLESREFAAYIQGPQGVGKSHTLYEAIAVLSLTPGCRVVYEHDCESWATYANKPIEAALYWIRAIAMGFSGDAPVVALCKEVTEKFAVMKDPADAESAVRDLFLPRLGDLCARLKLKVFFVFDQHNSLTAEMRKAFPYSLPESGLLHVSQLRGVGMVVISASANNEYFLKVAASEPPWPMHLVTSGFDIGEMNTFLRNEHMFVDALLNDDEVFELCVATNCYPLELTFLRDTYRALRKRDGAAVTIQRCIDVYERGDTMIGVLGRFKTFSNRVTLFDKRIRAEPDELKRLVNSVVCMKLELPLSTFPDAVLLNLAISYESNVPQSQSFTAKARMDGPADYIHPITPAALEAAMALYAPDASFSAREASAVEYVFQSVNVRGEVRGRMLEQYIMQQLSVAPSFKLSGSRLGKANVASIKLTTLAQARGVQVVRWNGNKLPPGKIDVAKDLLLWPRSASFPGVDGMLWLADTKTLVLLQITLSSVHVHKSNFWADDATRRSLWQDRLGARDIKELWLTPYTSAGKTRVHTGQYVCTLAQLLEHNPSLFPLLRKWEPAEEVGARRADTE